METLIWVEKWEEDCWTIEGFTERGNIELASLHEYVNPHRGNHVRRNGNVYYRESYLIQAHSRMLHSPLMG